MDPDASPFPGLPDSPTVPEVPDSPLPEKPAVPEAPGKPPESAPVRPPVPDDPGKAIPLVGEGDEAELIVVNVAGTDGNRFLAAEIYLIRKNPDDIGFPGIVSDRSRQLEGRTIDFLSMLGKDALLEPDIRTRVKEQLQKVYQKILGAEHPIREVVLARWIL